MSLKKSLAYRDLYALAQKHKVNIFRDKEVAFLGSGKGCYRVCLSSDITQIPWQDIYDTPIALVTGTNGKTTTVRLSYYICQQAGLYAGYASTDWVVINDEIVDAGDYSGLTGHQLVLTKNQVQVAPLESARGGLLKRGLAETQVKVASVTNAL